jgi:2-octaprenyl-6-methoxyphenol hydroxylase
MPAHAIDVLIRGAGPVGCTLALALRSSGLQVKLLHSLSQGIPAFRPLALSHASRLILERVGVWDALAVTPIMAIHVSQAGGFGRTRMEAADAGVPALGYVIGYAALAGELRARCEGLFIMEEPPTARCVVHAEGSAEQARESRYAQEAVVALVGTHPPAHATAFERFTAEGPLALLPLERRYAVIWSMRPDSARALAAASEEEFLGALAAAAGSAPGRPVSAEGRVVQALVLRVRASRIAPRSVYIGNAAQTLHPVAGQGLNLGLRDAWELARALHGASDPGDAAVLQRYAARRRLDAAATIGITHLLAAGFTGGNPLGRVARGAALAALDVFPGARRFFARRMIYGSSALP